MYDVRSNSKRIFHTCTEKQTCQKSDQKTKDGVLCHRWSILAQVIKYPAVFLIEISFACMQLVSSCYFAMVQGLKSHNFEHEKMSVMP